MSSLSSAQLQQLRQQLLQEKREHSKQLEANDNYGLEESTRDYTGELSMADNHPADSATEMYERGKDIALNEHTEMHLQEIEQALQRMETGGYGNCIVCGKEIAFERLEAVPTTQYCKEHVPEKQVSERRPVEEQFLMPPFGRTSTDEMESNAFDGEDAWQIVEHYGTSDSPAMAEEPDVNDYNGLYIEADEPDGYVEPIENFLASDLYGKPYEQIIRNHEYRRYMKDLDGSPGSELYGTDLESANFQDDQQDNWQ